jgi:hypothetical protein
VLISKLLLPLSETGVTLFHLSYEELFLRALLQIRRLNVMQMITGTSIYNTYKTYGISVKRPKYQNQYCWEINSWFLISKI